MKSVQPSEAFLQLPNNSESIANYGVGSAPANRTIAAASGTLSYNQDGLTILTQAADNALGSSIATNKHYLPAEDKACLFTARIKFAEAATNAANIYVGMSSSAAAALVGDNGAGPAASYTGFGFFKVDGGTLWNVEISNGGTQYTLLLDAATSLDKIAKVAGTGAWQTLEVDIKPKSATRCDVMFRIDGVTVAKFTDIVFTSMVATGEAVAIKAGSVSAETLLVAYDASVRNR